MYALCNSDQEQKKKFNHPTASERPPQIFSQIFKIDYTVDL